jgi:signal transduction histidine kinase/DNA-binding NarL/FixJ family response regulator
MKELFRKIIFICMIVLFICTMDGLVSWSMQDRTLTRNYEDLLGEHNHFEYRFGDSPQDASGLPLWIDEAAASNEWKWLDNDKLSVKERGDQHFVWLRIKLPEGTWHDPYLYVYRAYHIFELYADNKLIYASADLDEPSATFKGNEAHMIPIDPALLGKTVYFRIYSDTRFIGINAKIKLGSANSIIVNQIREALPKLIIGFISIFVGCISMLFYLRYRKEKMVLYFSLFSASSGLFVIFQLTNVTTILFKWNTPMLDYYLNMIVIFLVVFPFLSFVTELFPDPYNRIYIKFKQASGCLLGVGIVLSLLDPVYLITYYYYSVVSLFFLIMLIAIFYTLYKCSVPGRTSKEFTIFKYGFSIFLLVTIKDRVIELIIPFSYIPLHIQQSFVGILLKSSLEWSLVTLIATFGFILSRRFSQVYEQNKKYALLLEDQNAFLKQMNKLKDEFLAKTSHELQTPLNGIIGIAESLIEGAGGSVTDAVRQNLLMIAASGKRLSNLVNDILDYSKIKNNQIILKTKPIHMRELVEVVITLCKPLANQKLLRIVHSLDANVPLIYGDEDRIQQILYNLIGNAIKFTESGSVEVSAEAADGFLRIAIRDTGIGIPAEMLEVIFESFQQADNSYTRAYTGTGLGLYITRELVELHGGTIRAESVHGEGAVFTVALPLMDSRSLAAVSQMETSEAGNIRLVPEASIAPAMPSVVSYDLSAPPSTDTQFILVVEDEPINVQVLLNYLRLENYKIMVASNGVEALELINRGFEPDLIILDIMMPKMNGFEVCRKIRELYAINELPIILLSAKNMDKDLKEGFHVGANDYLTKPFSKTELLLRIKLHIQITKWNQSLEEEMSERTATVHNLLNHVSQGFLSFDHHLLISQDYSKQCEQIFDCPIGGLPFPELIYPDDLDQQLFVRKLLTGVFGQSDQDRIERDLSFLPTTAVIHDRTIDLEYRIATMKHKDNQRICMVVLTDITEQVVMKARMEKEKHAVKMLLSVASNKGMFLELVHKYEEFYRIGLPVWLDSELPVATILNDLQKKLHYFKGGFSQFYLVRTCELIYEFEILLQTLRNNTDAISHEDLLSFFASTPFESWLEEELGLIKLALGAAYLDNRDDRRLKEQLMKLENKVMSMFASPVSKVLIVELRKLWYRPIDELLQPFEAYISDLAESLGKRLNPLIIETDGTLIDSGQFTYLFDVIGHIMRNIVDHGIKPGDEQTPRTVVISAKFELNRQRLLIEVQHNGEAVDIEAVKAKVLLTGLYDEQMLASMTQEDVLQLVFSEGITTKHETTLLSGMGFGLSIVKEQIEHKGGSVRMSSNQVDGVSFLIHVPYHGIDGVDGMD